MLGRLPCTRRSDAKARCRSTPFQSVSSDERHGASVTSDEYRLIGVGERSSDADGSSRQDELARCVPWEALELRREPGNPRDPRAIAVYSCRGVQLGYLSRENAEWIAPRLDRGAAAEASVFTVAPKGRPTSPLALTLGLRLGGD